MANILRRMFSMKREKALVGIRGKVKLMEQDEQVDIEEFDAQDVSEYEADFMDVGKSYKMHKRYTLYSFDDVPYLTLDVSLQNITN